MNKAIALALAVLFVAAPAEAARWKRPAGNAKPIQVVDYTDMAVVPEAVDTWEDATVVKLTVVAGSPADAPTDCPRSGCAPVIGGITVVFANLGNDVWAKTRLAFDAKGSIIGATITVNSYHGDPEQFFTEEWNLHWLETQIGVAIANLTYACRNVDPAGWCRDERLSRPDAGDFDAVNTAYGR